jgi:hypothetical protein
MLQRCARSALLDVIIRHHEERWARSVLAESDETFEQVATQGRAPIAHRHRIGNAISSIEFSVEIRFVSWKECPFGQTF